MVLCGYLDIVDRRTAFLIHDNGWIPFIGAYKQGHGTALMSRAHHHLYPFARCVLRLIQDDLQVVETESGTVETLPTDRHQNSTLSLSPFGIREGVGQAILTTLMSVDRQLDRTILGGIELPLFDLLLIRLLLVIVADFVERCHALALDGFPIGSAPHEVGHDFIANLEVTSVEPGVNLEGMTSGNHRTRTDDGSAGGVDHFGGDLVTVVTVAVQGLGYGRVDPNLYFSIGADGDGLLLHDLFGA